MARFRNRRETDEVIDLRDEQRPTLAQLDGATAASRSEQYGEWAERLRAKREARRRELFGDPEQQGTASYWSEDALFEESRRVDEEELTARPDPRRVAELLAVFGLEIDATADDVAAAFRKLAKAHHPDRFASADEATREHHAERMRHVNATYRALRDLDRA